MWFVDAVTSAFVTPTHDARMQCFRILLGLACVAKFAIAPTHGGWSRLAPDGYPRYALERRFGRRRADLVAAWYRPLLCLRLVAALAYTVGPLPRLAAVPMICALVFELCYAWRSNTLYLALLLGCTLVAGDLGHGLALDHRFDRANTWAQFLVVLVTVDLYWNGVWQKLRSRQFSSGLILAQFCCFTARIRHRLRHREFFYPALVVRLLADGGPSSVARWRVLALATVVLETVLPVALLVPVARPYAIAAGILMHLCFMVLLPRQLIGFSMATVASYVLFAR